jgi:hypothetical protein
MCVVAATGSLSAMAGLMRVAKKHTVFALLRSSAGDPSELRNGLEDGNSTTVLSAARSAATSLRPMKPFEPITAMLTGRST